MIRRSTTASVSSVMIDLITVSALRLFYILGDSERIGSRTINAKDEPFVLNGQAAVGTEDGEQDDTPSVANEEADAGADAGADADANAETEPFEDAEPSKTEAEPEVGEVSSTSTHDFFVEKEEEKPSVTVEEAVPEPSTEEAKISEETEEEKKAKDDKEPAEENESKEPQSDES